MQCSKISDPTDIYADWPGYHGLKEIRHRGRAVQRCTRKTDGGELAEFGADNPTFAF